MPIYVYSFPHILALIPKLTKPVYCGPLTNGSLTFGEFQSRQNDRVDMFTEYKWGDGAKFLCSEEDLHCMKYVFIVK